MNEDTPLPMELTPVPPRYWKLDANRNPVPCGVHAWAVCFERADRIVARTEVSVGVYVSTVFIGLNQRLVIGRDDGAPLVFGSLVSGGQLDGEERFYATWAEAEAGHAALVEKVNT